MKRVCIVLALSLASAALVAACGGSGGDKNDETATLSGKTESVATSGTSTGGVTLGATAEPSTGAGEASTLTAAEKTTVADGGGVEGGDPGAPPVVVATVPPVTPRAGTTPAVDPTEIAPPNVPTADLALVVDMDASKPGIQSSRDLNPGDVFRVAVVVVAAPQFNNDIGGIAAFNFNLNYDKTKIVAPTIAGGASTSRNPTLNLAGLGGAAAQWQCLPTPEGDLDDPGGTEGDGKPETGQAYISCFAPGTPLVGGTLVIATIEFTAIARGSTELKLSEVAVADAVALEIAHCPGDSLEPTVPCQSGTANVK